MSTPTDKGGSDPGQWLVRFGGTTYKVKDESGLHRLLKIGKIPPSAMAKAPGSTRWEPLVAGKKETKGAKTRQLWSVWDDLDDAEPSVLVDSTPTDDHPAPQRDPTQGRWKPQESRRQVAAPPAQPTPPAPPVQPAPPTPPISSSPRVASKFPPLRHGKIIPFPGPRSTARPLNDGPAALAVQPVPFPEHSLPPSNWSSQSDSADRTAPSNDRGPAGGRVPPKPGTNWWRVAAVVALGLVLVVTVRAYVSTYTTPEFKTPTSLPAVRTGVAERQGAVPPGTASSGTASSGTASSGTASSGTASPGRVPHGALPPGADVILAARQAAATAAEQADTYQDVERELRALMMSGTLDSSSGEALETSLVIELNRIRLSVVRVDVRVLSTENRIVRGTAKGSAGGASGGVTRADVPKSVELRIVLRSDGAELDREIAAAALVVGKYVHAEHLDMPVFEVAFQGLADGKLMRKRIDSQLAQQFSLGRLSMGDFLEALTH